MTDNRKLYFIQNFGNNVAKLRKEKNIKQETLAEYVGISKNAISKIEQGTSYPSFANLDKIAEFFKTTPTQLFGTELEIQLEISEKNIDEYEKKASTILKANKAFNDLYNDITKYADPDLDYTLSVLGNAVTSKNAVDSLYKEIKSNTDPDFNYTLATLDNAVVSKNAIDSLYKEITSNNDPDLNYTLATLDNAVVSKNAIDSLYKEIKRNNDPDFNLALNISNNKDDRAEWIIGSQ